MRTLTSEEKLTLSKRLFPSFPSTFVRTLVQISGQQTLAFVQQKFRFFSFLFPFDIGNESRLKLRSAFVGIPKAAGNSSRLLHLRIEQKTHLRQKTCCFFYTNSELGKWCGLAIQSVSVFVSSYTMAVIAVDRYHKMDFMLMYFSTTKKSIIFEKWFMRKKNSQSMYN